MFSLLTLLPDLTEVPMAKTNYSFDKRQREIAKKKKKDEKRLRKLEKPLTPSDEETIDEAEIDSRSIGPV